ncbi:permease [Calderihabitans maritimus]|uniref:Permease n=1 Tax=Calderihabitans maritimus TaxID=1246530 RepID=A0A1Z5HQ01_9FIRM|nr:permease [Calderihabitans maritimus]GAW91391.1 permease [Calderihabitans maritimus]
MSFTFILYVISILSLTVSFIADRKKTKSALTKSYKAFLNIFPDLAAVLLIIGLVMTFISPEVISKFIGREAGIWGIALASVVGSITLIPGFVAFPLAASLLNQGAGLIPIAAFVSTLMMVGVVTMPMEIKFFGKRLAFLRNGLSFIYAVMVALAMGVLLA